MKRILLTIVALLVLVCPLCASDEDDVKATHRIVGDAAKTGNFTLLGSMIHPQAIGFLRESQIPVQLGGDYGVKEFLPSFLANISRFTLTTYNTVFRVVGNTGIVCITNTAVPNDKSKDKQSYNRGTFVYVKIQDQWKLFSWNISEIPLKKK